MSITQPIQTISPELSDRTLTMNLIWRGADDILLRSCEVFGRGFRNRLSFSENGQIENVLVPRLAHAIAVSLRTVPQGAHVLAMPEFMIEVPGLALSGAHFMVMEATEEVRSIILRFKEFLGSTSKAFQADIGFEEPAISHGDKLALNVLEEICMPILNLCHALDEFARAEGRVLDPCVQERAQEFHFQTELLKRFVAASVFESGERALTQDQLPYLGDQK